MTPHEHLHEPSHEPTSEDSQAHSNLRAHEPSRAEIDAIEQPVVIEFGTPWCGHCQAAQVLIGEAFAARSGFRHIRIEDGKGRRLGRLFAVKLWPTLVFLNHGNEVAKLVRPQSAADITAALDALLGAPHSID